MAKWTNYSLFSKCGLKVILTKFQWQLTPNLTGPGELQGICCFWHLFHFEQCELEGVHLTKTVTEHSREEKLTFWILFLSE